MERTARARAARGEKLRAQVVARGLVLAERLDTAQGEWSKTVGLIGRSGLADGEGLWIVPCNGIHMMFMGFAIDAVFLDSEGFVVRVARNLAPWWGMVPWVRRARSVLELPVGAAAGVARGDLVEIA